MELKQEKVKGTQIVDMPIYLLWNSFLVWEVADLNSFDSQL
jgi:hypothetical protein